MDDLKIKIDRIESAGELKRLIQDNQLLKLDETCNAYYYIEIEKDYLLGIECNSYGTDIEYKFADNNQYIYIGVGMHLLCLNIKKRDVCFCKELDSVFFEILTDSCDCYYVVLCELDLYVYKNNNQMWKTGFRDIVVDYELMNDKYIRVVSDSGEETTFSINDGSVIKWDASIL